MEEGRKVTVMDTYYMELTGKEHADVKEVIEKICHWHKHRYLEGFPCGRRARKEIGKVFLREDHPKICFTYLVLPTDNGTIVRVLVSSVEDVFKRFTRKEVLYFVQMYLQDVSDEIEYQLQLS